MTCHLLSLSQEFDKKYNPTWHCIVGRNFGSYVTHETKHFIYFYLGQVAILLFKSGWNATPPPETTFSPALNASVPPPFHASLLISCFLRLLLFATCLDWWRAIRRKRQCRTTHANICTSVRIIIMAPDFQMFCCVTMQTCTLFHMLCNNLIWLN